jgi:molybdopterin-guanine dinucleotide biosynthesis protein A
MTLTAVLLAGGESRRMGTEKATIVFNGEPFWQRQIKLLRHLGPENILVSARTERSWRPADTELVLDQPPSRGPISGLTAALGRTRTSHLMALGVDMPFVTTAQLQDLCRRASAGCGVVPTIEERVEPLAAVYPVEAYADFTAALTGNDWSLQSLVRRLADEGKVQLVNVAEAEVELYRSVNEPQDLTSPRR